MTTLTTSTGVQGHEVVSPKEWLESRKEFLRKEKEFTRLRDELSRQRRELPWEKVDKNYVFDRPNGKVTLAELFGGRSQLIVYHFMFGPGWEAGCPSCSYLADHFGGSLVHLANRDVTLAVVSRAPIEQIEAFKKRMGWQFRWVSSFANDFNRDYHVSFTKEGMQNGKVEYNYEMIEFPSEEAPGASVFYKNEAGEIFHTYSTYARGLDILVGAYNFLDLAPKGRDEDGLAFSMAWVRHHDKYTEGYVVDPKAGYVAPKVVASSCCAEHKS
ncbi:MAG: thioredoxin family protein [Candidatus Sulfotelmatobacter sp.]